MRIDHLPHETPMPFVLSPSATLRRALSKDEFAEIIVCTIPSEQDKLMATVDRFNCRYPKGITISAAIIVKNGKPKAECVSKR